MDCGYALNLMAFEVPWNSLGLFVLAPMPFYTQSTTNNRILSPQATSWRQMKKSLPSNDRKRTGGLAAGCRRELVTLAA